MLPMQQHHVEVLSIGEFSQLIDLLKRICSFTRGHFRHNPIAIAGDSFQGDSEHPVHFGV